MHSAFLSELLSPKGTHGQKDNFLKEFIKVFQVEKFTEFDCTDSIVSPEIKIGEISEDYTSGGRLDIVITSGNKSIVIENKIYATDGKNQLLRYKNSCPNAEIFYLILIGNPPSPESKGTLKDDDYKCRSYSTDIIRWLEKCREKSVMLPMLRECISQYINLIKHLTHQSTNKIQEMEIQKLLLGSPEKFETALSIASEIAKIQTNIFSECKKDLANSWSLEYGALNNEVELFEFNDFVFYIKLSEKEYFHFELFPKKK